MRRWGDAFVALLCLASVAGCQHSTSLAESDADDEYEEAVDVQTAPAPGEPATEKSAAPIVRKRKRRAVAAGPADITFEDLKLSMVQETPFTRELLTPRVNELVGQPVRLRGYILPQSVFQNEDFEYFVLVRDNQACCFGPGALLHDCVVVQMNPGKTASFTSRPVAVEGRFSIDEQLDDEGAHQAIYRLDADSVQ